AASLQGYLAQKQTVRAQNGEPVSVEITLRAGIPITIYPADAKLTIDGEPVTITDGMLPIDPTMAGIHQLVASKPGFHAESASLPANRIDMALRPLGAYFRVDGGAGAALVVDGEARGQLPLAEPLELDGGSHTIEVRGPGRRVLRKTSNLPAGKQATMH